MKIYNLKTIQFRPYAETGEFASVGVILYSLEDGYFDYRICKGTDLNRVNSRIRGFFPEIPERLFRDALAYIKLELKRVIQIVGQKQRDLFVSAPEMISNLCRPRENIIRFGHGIVVMCEDPVKELDAQYKNIVLRGFIDEEGTYVQDMKRNIKHKLEVAKIKCTYDYKVHARYNYDLTLPFYFDLVGQPQALRPLDLNKKKAQDIVSQIVQWRYNARVIKEKIQGIDLVCPARFPSKGTEPYNAAMDLIGEVKELFRCVEYSDDVVDSFVSKLPPSVRDAS